MQEKLVEQVKREYSEWFQHIRQERERKRHIMEKVLDQTLPEGKVRVNLLWRNTQLELALFLTDEMGVKFLSSSGVIGEEMMNNANAVAKYDDIDMNLRAQRETIVNHNSLYGLSVTVVDAWDNDEKQPIGDVLDPLSIIVDPHNYNDSKMRFFWVERRVSRNYLENTEGFEGVEWMSFSKSSELELNKRSSDNANNLVSILTSDDGMVDIYDHFMVHNGMKVLTTWTNDRSILIRYIEIEPLSKAEKAKPTKVKFPIQFHRRKPKLGSVYGVSIADEVLQFQDVISKLTNLEVVQATNLALGPDLFIDDRLGIDTVTLSETSVWGRIIPMTNDTGLPSQNGMSYQQIPPPSPFVDQMIGKLEQRAEGTTNVTQQAFGMSPGGSQTKAEIQQLQQNANQILIWIANNYLQGQKEYWEAHYRCYVANMDKGKKRVALYDKGNTISLSLTREQFIDDGKISVYITSKAQDAIENDKEFNKLLALANIYLGNMKPGYSLNDFLRMMGKKSNIRDFDSYRYIQQDVDEYNATKNLPLLNKDIEVPGPADGENYMTYILIYRQALDTKAKAKVLMQYEEAYTTIQKPEEEAKAMQAMMMGRWGESNTGVWNPQTSNTALNNLNQGSQQASGITKQ